MRIKNAFITILFGMICAALIMTLGSTLADAIISGEIWTYIDTARGYIVSLTGGQAA